jgi:hypothetical protein
MNCGANAWAFCRKAVSSSGLNGAGGSVRVVTGWPIKVKNSS